MDSKHEQEASLIALVAQGDQSAAEAFDAGFRPFLLRFLQGRVRPDQQDDLVQETFLAAFQAIKNGNFQGRSALGTWLVGILKHKIADHWSSHQWERNTLIPIAAPPLSDTGSRVDAVAERRSDPSIGIEVEQLLQCLPKLHRAVLLLNIREGLNTEQIASAVKLPPGTVGRILWEAKRMLGKKPELKKLPPQDDQ